MNKTCVTQKKKCSQNEQFGEYTNACSFFVLLHINIYYWEAYIIYAHKVKYPGKNIQHVKHTAIPYYTKI